MPLSRRSFSRSLLAAPAVSAGFALTATTARAERPASLPPHAQIQIGRFTVHVLTDGHYDMPYGFFTGQSPEETAAAAEAAHLARPGGALRLGFTQYLVDDGERLVLIDSGPAGGIGEHTGRLPGALEALGVAPGDIDAVILTHTHFDHISGAIAGGQKVFANAELYVDRRDIAYFTDPGRRAAAPDFLHSSFDATAELVRLYPNMQRIEGDHDIMPGLSTVDLTGHTPGQIGVRITDAGESLLQVSDMLFHPLVHPRPGRYRLCLRAGSGRGPGHAPALLPHGRRGGRADRGHPYALSGPRPHRPRRWRAALGA